MGRRDWQATVHGIMRVRHDLGLFFFFYIKGVQYRKGEKEDLVNIDNYFK